MLKACIKTFDTRISRYKVRLSYNVGKKVVRIVCKKPEIGAEYLSNLIVEKKVGPIDSVIYSRDVNSTVVGLIRGSELDRFLRLGQRKIDGTPTRKSFSELADGSS